MCICGAFAKARARRAVKKQYILLLGFGSDAHFQSLSLNLSPPWSGLSVEAVAEVSG